MKFRSLKMREFTSGMNNTMGNLVTTIQTRSAPAQGIKALVLTCIDFRLIEAAVTYLNSQDYEYQYDEFILAGASLGYNTSLNVVNSQFSGWDKVLENHIDISYALHTIKEIIVIDHMDCGAYKAQLNGGPKNTIEKYQEVKYHIENLNKFRNTINTKYIKEGGSEPKYAVKLWLMRLNGTVDINPTYWQFTTTTKKVPKNNVVVIGNGTLNNNLTNVGTIDEPLSTLSSLRYKILDASGNEILDASGNVINSSDVSVSNLGSVWYIQSKSSASEFGALNSAEYRLQLVDSLAYIKVKMSVESTSDVDITFTFEQSDYF